MFQTLVNAWKIADLRKKILYTLMIIVIYRVGSAIPVPFLNPEFLQSIFTSSGSLLGYMNILTGGALAKSTVFALSISPYITASIVIQLLTIAIPPLERLAKEGEEGKKKINKITRYTTVALALLESVAYYIVLRNYNAVEVVGSGFESFFVAVIIVLTFMAGSMLVVWLGDRIDQKGIGNGISIILFAGIVSRGYSVVVTLYDYIMLGISDSSQIGYLFGVPIVVILFLVLIAFIVLMTNAERRIPVQYAKRVVGRKMYGGQASHIPVKVNMSGVLPVIFASAFLAIPGTIGSFIDPSGTGTGFWAQFLRLFNYDTWLYGVLYFLLILAFNYFYVAIQYNPVEMANNLRKNSGTIPGIRPGKPTSDFIAKVISKITLLGALFLGIVAVLPIVFGAITKMNIALGGTSIIILVGVALDTVRQLESQMMMRHYKGFLE